MLTFVIYVTQTKYDMNVNDNDVFRLYPTSGNCYTKVHTTSNPCTPYHLPPHIVCRVLRSSTATDAATTTTCSCTTVRVYVRDLSVLGGALSSQMMRVATAQLPCNPVHTPTLNHKPFTCRLHSD